MKRHLRCTVAIIACLISRVTGAQSAPRPTVTVRPFEYGTVAAGLWNDDDTRRRLQVVGVYDVNSFAATLGAGAADLIVEKLVQSDRFRVVERAALDAVQRERDLDPSSNQTLTRARYVITGSVTRLGRNDKKASGVVAGVAAGHLFGRLAALNGRRSSTTVHLTARVIDANTGEIIGSFTGEGESNKRWSVGGFGIGPGGFGGGQMQDQNFRESAIGEAVARAADQIVDHVIALRATKIQS